MNRAFRLFLLLLFAVTACRRQDTYTVIVSLDGNRWDYPAYYEMPFFDSLAAVGVQAVMEPSFPASTFPNHYTMATGCVPDHNGIVNNSFRDPDDGSHYAMQDSSKRFNPKYYLKEPIWITAQKQGLKTGNIYWLGGDVAIQGTYPTYWRNWNEQPHWEFEERVDEAVRLMSLPKKDRPRLLMVYFDEPDHTGHVFGPIAAETAEMTHRMDSLMHDFYLRLMKLPHAKKINFILAGDHGMTPISPDRFVSWAEALDDAWIEDIVGSIPTSIYCKDGCMDTVYRTLSRIPHLNVYRHGEMPDSLDYGTSDRLGDIIVAPDLGWQFNYAPSRNQGTHGYAPQEADMLVAFRAVGPAFKKGYEARPYQEGRLAAFKNVDLYPMLCKLLGIKPAPVDGSLERIEQILK
jgi:predicted AlkP superfamily pyrophosphatase or phosphodiesterase